MLSLLLSQKLSSLHFPEGGPWPPVVMSTVVLRRSCRHGGRAGARGPEDRSNDTRRGHVGWTPHWERGHRGPWGGRVPSKCFNFTFSFRIENPHANGSHGSVAFKGHSYLAFNSGKN
ncbi:hypothetical protein AGIG_G10161 [Arapaima gigas]